MGLQQDFLEATMVWDKGKYWIREQFLNEFQTSFIFSGALHRRQGDFNAAIDDYLLAMDKTDHDEFNTTYKEAQRQLLLCYNDFAVECFRWESAGVYLHWQPCWMFGGDP